jgi:adenosylmethionine-8-amino-7-oxononanoate aminotransferase
VRVKGAIGVVEMDHIENLNVWRQHFIAEGVFVRPFGSAVYLAPAFTIAGDDLIRLMEAVRQLVATHG